MQPSIALGGRWEFSVRWSEIEAFFQTPTAKFFLSRIHIGCRSAVVFLLQESMALAKLESAADALLVFSRNPTCISCVTMSALCIASDQVGAVVKRFARSLFGIYPYQAVGPASRGISERNNDLLLTSSHSHLHRHSPLLRTRRRAHETLARSSRSLLQLSRLISPKPCRTTNTITPTSDMPLPDGKPAAAFLAKAWKSGNAPPQGPRCISVERAMGQRSRRIR